MAPALGLTPLGYLTSPVKRAPCSILQSLLRSPRRCAVPTIFRTALDAWRILFMADAARSYDSR